MLSSRRAEKSTAGSIGRCAGWAACGLAAIAVTLGSMGHWPRAAIGGMTPVAIQATTPGNTGNANKDAAPHSPLQPVSSTHPGIDVLARLEAAARSSAIIQPDPNTSSTLNEALQRALSYPDFSALAGRSDPEGLVEAAAWADACTRGAMAAQEASLRCGDVSLHGAHYADELLKKAADAGQPAAVLTLAERYPAQWVDIPLLGGNMLGDRVFTLAARGNPAALAMLSRLCAVPDACSDSLMTRNVLALLQLSIYKTGTSESGDYLSGPESDRRAAVDRTAQLRTLLKWPS